MRIRLALLLLFGLSQSMTGFAAAVTAGAAHASVAQEHCAAAENEAHTLMSGAVVSIDPVMADCADGCQLCVACSVVLTSLSLPLATCSRDQARSLLASPRLMAVHELLFRPPIYT